MSSKSHRLAGYPWKQTKYSAASGWLQVSAVGAYCRRRLRKTTVGASDACSGCLLRLPAPNETTARALASSLLPITERLLIPSTIYRQVAVAYRSELPSKGDVYAQRLAPSARNVNTPHNPDKDGWLPLCTLYQLQLALPLSPIHRLSRTLPPVDARRRNFNIEMVNLILEN